MHPTTQSNVAEKLHSIQKSTQSEFSCSSNDGDFMIKSNGTINSEHLKIVKHTRSTIDAEHATTLALAKEETKRVQIEANKLVMLAEIDLREKRIGHITKATIRILGFGGGAWFILRLALAYFFR